MPRTERGRDGLEDQHPMVVPTSRHYRTTMATLLKTLRMKHDKEVRGFLKLWRRSKHDFQPQFLLASIITGPGPSYEQLPSFLSFRSVPLHWHFKRASRVYLTIMPIYSTKKCNIENMRMLPVIRKCLCLTLVVLTSVGSLGSLWGIRIADTRNDGRGANVLDS